VVVEQLRAGFLRALSPDHANREPQPPQFAPAAEIAPKTIPLPQKGKPPLQLARFGYAADPLPAYEIV
jgi:hypothetical protein